MKLLNLSQLLSVSKMLLHDTTHDSNLCHYSKITATCNQLKQASVANSEHEHYVTKINLLFISSDLMCPSTRSFSILLSNFFYLDSPFAPSIFSWSFSFFRLSRSSFCRCLSSCLRRYLAAASSFSFRWSAHWSSCHSRRTLRHLKGKQRKIIYQHVPYTLETLLLNQNHLHTSRPHWSDMVRPKGSCGWQKESFMNIYDYLLVKTLLHIVPGCCIRYQLSAESYQDFQFVFSTHIIDIACYQRF